MNPSSHLIYLAVIVILIITIVVILKKKNGRIKELEDEIETSRMLNYSKTMNTYND